MVTGTLSLADQTFHRGAWSSWIIPQLVAHHLWFSMYCFSITGGFCVMYAWAQAMARAEQPVVSALCLGSWTMKCGDRDAKYSPSGPLERTHTLSPGKIITVKPSWWISSYPEESRTQSCLEWFCWPCACSGYKWLVSSHLQEIPAGTPASASMVGLSQILWPGGNPCISSFFCSVSRSGCLPWGWKNTLDCITGFKFKEHLGVPRL